MNAVDGLRKTLQDFEASTGRKPRQMNIGSGIAELLATELYDAVEPGLSGEKPSLEEHVAAFLRNLDGDGVELFGVLIKAAKPPPDDEFKPNYENLASGKSPYEGESPEQRNARHARIVRDLRAAEARNG